MGSSSAVTAAIAGCTGLFETQSVPVAPPVVENRPDAVYYPSHIEGMKMAGLGPAGDYRVALSFSYPHRFWIVTGTRTERVDLTSNDTIHLMASVWDGESGTVLPVASGLSFEILRDGQTVDELTPWPMISQNMGFHYGDNVSLEGDGTYRVRVRIGRVEIGRYGAFADKFGEAASTEIDLEYSRASRDEITFTTLDERQGQPGSLNLMELEMVPTSQAPRAGDLPGTVLGEATSGDAVFLATVLSGAPFAEAGTSYLSVSPRTPHNRVPLPMMSLSGNLERGGETIFSGPLNKAIEPTLGYHYGTAVEPVESGDTFTVSIDAPPQVARHEGYETAFLDMSPVSFTVP